MCKLSLLHYVIQPVSGYVVVQQLCTEAAKIGLQAINNDLAIPYIEVRFWDNLTFNAWHEECRGMSLSACDEEVVRQALWGGLSLVSWTHERRKRNTGFAYLFCQSLQRIFGVK